MIKKNITFFCRCIFFISNSMPMPNRVVLYTLKHFDMRGKYFNCHINRGSQMESFLGVRCRQFPN